MARIMTLVLLCSFACDGISPVSPDADQAVDSAAVDAAIADAATDAIAVDAEGPCGRVSWPCCGGGVCPDKYAVCDTGTDQCVRCGQPGERCCGSETECDVGYCRYWVANLRCTNGGTECWCEACGGIDEPCCVSETDCGAGDCHEWDDATLSCENGNTECWCRAI